MDRKILVNQSIDFIMQHLDEHLSFAIFFRKITKSQFSECQQNNRFVEEK